MASADDRSRLPADVSARLTRMVRHDLRGALNVLHLHLELLTSDDERVTVVQRTQQAAAIRTACGSVFTLLPLAVEALPPVDGEADVVVPDALVESVAARLKPLIDARGLTIASDARDCPAIRTSVGDARARLVGALLDVVEESPRGSTIQLGFEPARRRVLVTSSAGPTREVVLEPEPT